MKRPVTIALLAILLMAVVSCQGPQYITSDPVILLNYQNDPSHESLDALSKSYLNTINQNRKTGRIEPGLYSDYAVTLYLLGKPEAATSWFNKEVATFPYTAEYVRQLREDLEVRFNGADPTKTRRYTIEDIESMDQIVELRPTENRQPSQLPKETMQNADIKSREAVRGLDKPLTRDEKQALKKAGKDNRRQDKAAQEGNFTAPTQASEMAARKTKSEEAMQNAKAKNNTKKKGLFGRKQQENVAKDEGNVTIETDTAQGKLVKSKKAKFNLFGKKRKERVRLQKEETENMAKDEANGKREQIEEKANEKPATRAEKKAAKQKAKAERQAAKDKAKADKAKAGKSKAKASKADKKDKKKSSKRKQDEDKDFKDAFGD